MIESKYTSRLVHGHKRKKWESPTYRSWQAMHERCSPKHKDREIYFDRGIKVCEQWFDFVSFLYDMHERPEGTQLGRIDNDRGYDADNCRWETPQQNNNNRRDNRMITYAGRTLTMAEWAREVGLSYYALKSRIYHHWPIEKALTLPPQPPGPPKRAR